eukprot:3301665-Ditylum_brightwellii.AAC.1
MDHWKLEGQGTSHVTSEICKDLHRVTVLKILVPVIGDSLQNPVERDCFGPSQDPSLELGPLYKLGTRVYK